MSMRLEKNSPCKVNLLLNILGRRADGYHELETVMHPVKFCDVLSFERTSGGVELTCSDARLPVDARNLAHRAATAFLQAAGIAEGARIHLEKRIPLAAGLGGGSGNAATTLLGLNELFGEPLSMEKLHELAAGLGSDINFFLQTGAALATGRGEKIEPLGELAAMRGAVFLLIHPGFGISTAWAYQNLGRFPEALNGRPGRARQLVSKLQAVSVAAAGREFYNSLESPALEKFPLLALFQEWLRENGAAAMLMSGSGSTTFAIFEKRALAEASLEGFRTKFGETNWTVVVDA
jgi:4-diphosphocytidyl-2-C-methyl-D-erythritol kinase